MEDENDLLSTHKFIATPKEDDTPAHLNEEYKKFYREEVSNTSRDEENDPNDI